MNKIVRQRIANNELFVLALFAMVFAAVNVLYSAQYGRLAVPPTYDDIGYISSGFALLEAGYQHGWGHWLLELFTRTWHAPVAVLQACLAFAVFGKSVWAPYLLNGLYLLVLLICLRRELASVSMSTFSAIAISILAWPLTGHLIVEFRPDIPTNLFLALGTWRLAKRHEEIGQGQCHRLHSVCELSWPFLAALWLKPSFSPVVVGLWLSAWILLCGVNHFVQKVAGGLRNTLASFAAAALFLFLFFIPYLVVGGHHLVQYFTETIFTDSQELWSPPLSSIDNLKYYVIGPGGWATMKWWSVVTTAVAIFAFAIAVRSRDHKAIRIGAMYVAFAFVAWVGMTVLRNKSPWFGSVVSSHFIGIFIAASGYTVNNLRKIPAAYYSHIALLVLLGLGLHSWPSSGVVSPGLSFSEVPAFSREAKRVFADTCNTIRDHAGGSKVSVLMPAISLMVNPNLIELCGIEGEAVPTDAPRIYMQPYNQMLTTIQARAESGVPNMLALVLSTDFPGIPGNMPTSRHMGSMNYLFSSSKRFELVGVIRGPNDTGQIRVFKKTAPATPTEVSGPEKTVVNHAPLRESSFSRIDFLEGFGDIEGPYKKWELPVVIWGRGNSSRIGIAGPRSGSGVLLIDWRPGVTVNAIDVLDKDVSVGRCTSGEQSNDFRHCQIPLPSGTMSGDLILRYAGDKQILSNKMNNSVLFKRIQLVETNG